MSWIGSALAVLAVVATVQMFMLVQQRRRLGAELRRPASPAGDEASRELIDSLVAEGRISAADAEQRGDTSARRMLAQTEPIFRATLGFFALTVPAAVVCVVFGWFAWIPAAVMLLPMVLLGLSVPILLISLRRS